MHRYCDNDQLVDNVNDQGERRYLGFHNEGVKEEVRTSLKQRKYSLIYCLQVAAKDMVEILLAYPDVD